MFRVRYAVSVLVITVSFPIRQVLFSFMVGMTNLYRYYGTHVDANKRAASETFKG